MSKAVILCVDDELMVLETLEMELQKAFGERYHYEFAESAEEALEIITELDSQHTEILVIISDWLMPCMKGDEFLITVHQQFPRIIKVMLTGQADNAAIDRTRNKANLYSYVSKPWVNQNLIDTIEQGIVRYATSR
jgi:CheY-like chemotaxis protein